MNDHESQMIGQLGCYVDEKNVINFQMGSNPLNALYDPGFTEKPRAIAPPQRWINVKGYNIATRGMNNALVEEMEFDIKRNRLLPRLYDKQFRMLYGNGPQLYFKEFQNGKIIKHWVESKEVTSWLDNWENNGMETSCTDFITGVIKNYYYYHDFFAKMRMSYGASIGSMPIAGIELVENKFARLATNKTDVATSTTTYKDLRFAAVGNWQWGGVDFSIYPRFELKDINNYRFAAISHHRDKSVGDFYGCNETHAGTLEYIRGANQTPTYINSFLRNSLAAKVHVIIPDSWVESKRKQIKAICDENKKREKDGKELLKYAKIEVGTDFKESFLIEYINVELRKLSSYLSGAENQGKAYATYSYNAGQNGSVEQRWKIENVDLKYKEYIESLITYDKRADEVITSSVGLDSSISNISKDGIISKSGSDVYYNYLLYLLNLTPDDEKCSEPLNIALRVNFPKLWVMGYRIGFYRETPSRQEDIAPSNRLNNQQS